MTLVNFGSGKADAIRAHRPFPGEGEQAMRIAIAKPIGAFPAHAGRCCGAGDAAGPGEDIEEGELAGGGPAVEAGVWRAASTSLEHKGGAVGQDKSSPVGGRREIP